MDESQDPTLMAGRLLRDARFMAGLTQAQVAHRAGISQQTVALYERGARQPSFPTLSRLVAGCDLELACRLVPYPGLEDESTREFLARAPLDRVDPVLSSSLLRILLANRHLTIVIGGKLAAGLQGAKIRIDEIELWVDPRSDLGEVNPFLSRAEIKYVSPDREVYPAEADLDRLRDGYPLATLEALVRLRGPQQFDGIVQRAVSVPVLGREHSLLVASPNDCARFWHPRELDHLALQRAVRLAS